MDMEYLTVLRIRDGKAIRVLKISQKVYSQNLKIAPYIETWYIVPIPKGVMAMTPSDFEMGYIRPE